MSYGAHACPPRRKHIKDFVGHQGPVLALAMSPDVSIVASGGSEAAGGLKLRVDARMLRFACFFCGGGCLDGIVLSLLKGFLKVVRIFRRFKRTLWCLGAQPALPVRWFSLVAGLEDLNR